MKTVTRDSAAQIHRGDELTVSSVASIYGCTGLFDLCGEDDLLSLTMAGSNKFLDWLGWERTDVCRIEKNFISSVRPSESGSRQGWITDACEPGNSVDFGTACFRYDDFGRFRRNAPVEDLTRTAVRLCDRQPRYRLNGTRITNESEFRSVLAAEALSQDIATQVIIGNNATPGQFDGLEQLVTVGYVDCRGNRQNLMDSIVIDWNSNDMDGGAGITWSDGRGTRAVAATFDFFDVLRSVVRRIKQRISWAPALNASAMRVGDMILLLTTEMTECLLDLYTCWSVCPGVAFNEANINTLEARAFRDTLMGGMFGDGKIFVDGFEIPLLAYDWELQKGPTRSDIYLLTGQMGAVKTLHAQYNDLSVLAAINSKFESSDGGRFLIYDETDHTCLQQNLEIQPRMLSWAPWANARFTDVVCRTPGGHVSPDPFETSFFPDLSWVPAS